MANRIDPKKRTVVLAFVKKFDAEHNGRGGQAAAAKAFGITYRTINSWVKSDDNLKLLAGSDSQQFGDNTAGVPAMIEHPVPALLPAACSDLAVDTRETANEPAAEVMDANRLIGFVFLDFPAVRDALRTIEEKELRVRSLVSEIVAEKRKLRPLFEG